ncbi:MAG: ATP-binding cassette domain-containing protein, partial [Lachnospiraceae bacterium]|nr:ATP-binding cassette domain-containing protein [Lachnospiraceae bacterium]
QHLVVPIEITDAPNATDLSLKSGKIEFENVSFGYNRNKVIKNLNLVIRPHEKVGIVGTSGSGKTTLINLLMRFYDSDAGQILIDNTDIKSVTQTSLHPHSPKYIY